MPRGIHQVQMIGLAVLGLVFQAHGLSLDRNPALALKLHIVEHLFGHLTLSQPATLLDQAVGQSRFPVVDMSHDGEISDMGKVCHLDGNKARTLDVTMAVIQSVTYGDNCHIRGFRHSECDLTPDVGQSYHTYCYIYFSALISFYANN